MAKELEEIEDIRADFMRRWFAIAISVGFATTVVRMPWVQQGVTPTYHESEQLARLSVALLATILSWEGYLQSIQAKPLFDIWRYFIDVGLVFLYLFLLLTSQFPNYWLSLHAISFGLYMLWDFLTIAQYPDKFPSSSSDHRLPAVYFRSFTGSDEGDRGPAITIMWAVYFIFLWWRFPAGFPHPTFVFAFFVLLGLAGYRLNKRAFRKSAWFTYVAPLTLVVVISLGRCLFF